MNWLGLLLSRFQHEEGRTHREQQRSGGVVPQPTEAKQKKNAGTVMCCWEYSEIRGTCKTDAWKSILTRQHQPDMFQW